MDITLGVNQWGNYRWWKWWTDWKRLRDRRKKQQVRNRQTAMRLTEGIRAWFQRQREAYQQQHSTATILNCHLLRNTKQHRNASNTDARRQRPRTVIPRPWSLNFICRQAIIWHTMNMHNSTKFTY